MKCLVCSKIFEGNKCPRCEFPNIQIPGGPEEYEAGLEALKPMIEQRRRAFLEGIDVGIVIYHWKDQDGAIVEDREETVSFGRGDELRQREVWLDRKFARIPDEPSLPLRVAISVGGKKREEALDIPNLLEAELQEIGIAMDEEFNICLMLRNESGTPTKSRPIPLFA